MIFLLHSPYRNWPIHGRTYPFRFEAAVYFFNVRWGLLTAQLSQAVTGDMFLLNCQGATSIAALGAATGMPPEQDLQSAPVPGI